MARDLLREFIRENLGAMFGLDRQVTMNALADTVSGPSPVDKWAAAQDQHEPVTSYELALSIEPEQVSAVDRLTPEGEDQDDPEDASVDSP